MRQTGIRPGGSPAQAPEEICRPYGWQKGAVPCRPSARFGVLKVGDLYRQQVRVHAWKFWNGRLPENQAAMLGRVGSLHGHATRSAQSGLVVATRDHGSVGYRVPTEWRSLTEEQRALGSVSGFKRSSRAGFLGEYGGFVCRAVGCGVCGHGDAGGDGV